MMSRARVSLVNKSVTMDTATSFMEIPCGKTTDRPDAPCGEYEW
jgi:hypothetical protein